MTTKLAQGQALARQADRVANSRGHRLGAWLWRTQGNGRTGEAVCRECGKGAFVRTDPAPNEINISGEAVALNCTEGLTLGHPDVPRLLVALTKRP